MNEAEAATFACTDHVPADAVISGEIRIAIYLQDDGESIHTCVVGGLGLLQQLGALDLARVAVLSMEDE